MRIKSLRLKNFRQFKGDAAINFSCDTAQNVTIILGDNTFGKTTLLQAFNWCLYGEANLPNEKFLLNYEVAAQMQNGNQELVEVEIILLHDNAEYIINRSQRYFGGNGSPRGEAVPTISVSRKGNDGQTRPIDERKIRELINNILPKDLSTYFFFDTERISTISDRRDIANAVKNFLGLSALENALRHLGDRSKKTTVIGKIYGSMDTDGDAQAQAALNHIQTAQEKRTALEEQLTFCQDEIARFEERKAKVEQILRDNQTTAELQKRKDKLERDIAIDEKNLSNTVDSYFREFSDGALKFFIQPLLGTAEDILHEIKIDDKGVRDITKASIMELIRRGRCICGREICEGNEAHQQLLAEIAFVPPESIGVTVRHYRERLKDFSRNDQIYERLQRLLNDFDSTQGRIQDAQDELDELRKKISGKENMDRYERELSSIRRRLHELQNRKDEINREDGRLAAEIGHQQKIYDSLTSRSAKNREAQKFLNYAEELKEWLEPTCRKKENDIRQTLETEVNKIFDEMYHGHRRVEIDEQYRVELITTVEGTEILSGESEGANRVKNFAFIAGLVDLAKKQILRELGLSSEAYPLVMDAPFSNADEKHTANISRALPKIAEQIVMFVMRKDWQFAKPVMNQRVGKKYLLNKISETFTKIEEA